MTVEGAICALIGLCQARPAVSGKLKHELAEISRWPDLLKQLQLVLHDASNKQIRNPLVRNWLLDLEHLVYDAEDVLEEFNHHVLLRQRQRKRDKVRDYVSHPVSSIQFRKHIFSQLRTITNKLLLLMEEKQKLDLFSVNSNANQTTGHPYTGCLIGDEVVYGRHEENEKIIKLLVDENTKDTISVIPIVGMGGMGKTTLARYVFNDDTVVGHFDVRIWVCVSTDYDVLRIMKAILEGALSRQCEFTELPMVEMKLHEALKGMRFLLVLDDVWNKSDQHWSNLRAPLTGGLHGSKIIITTRLEEVADAMRTEDYEPLKKLDDADCWRLFCRHANLGEGEDEGLKIKRMQISNKCNGLPHLAMALGALLRYRRRGEDWEDVLREESGDAVERTRSVMRLSYYELPPELKRCFVFCATFPAAYAFKENDLVLIWLGLGLVSWEGIREVEDEEGRERNLLGHKYFRDLVSRSLFLPSRSQNSRFVMHDLVRDVALEFSAMACCAREKEASEKSPWFRTRHLSFHSDSLNTIAREIEAEASSVPLRSFLHLSGSLNRNEEGKNVNSILHHLKHLRLLSLHKSMDAELPGSIGTLPQLRYLDLEGRTRTLPKSIAVLYRLEILILRGCVMLSELPSNIGSLRSLKYLNASFTKITTLPISIAKLESLEYLILSNCERLEVIPSEIGKLLKLRQKR